MRGQSKKQKRRWHSLQDKKIQKKTAVFAQHTQFNDNGHHELSSPRNLFPDQGRRAGTTVRCLLKPYIRARFQIRTKTISLCRC